MDKRLLQELDDKVADQQSTLQSAGMPGFYVTNDPKVIANGDFVWHQGFDAK